MSMRPKFETSSPLGMDTIIIIRADEMGDGSFGAQRGGRKHRGIDLKISPGQEIFSPIDGTVKRLGICYSSPPVFDLIEIEGDGVIHRLLYVEPSVTFGVTVRAGDHVGVAQNLQTRYGEYMIPHVHWEVMIQGTLFDKGKDQTSEVWINPLDMAFRS